MKARSALGHGCCWLHRCRRRHPVNTANTLFSFFLYFFLRIIPLLHSLLLSGNRRDRLETLSHCAESSQLAVKLFFRNIETKYIRFIILARHPLRRSQPASQTGVLG